jgi:hypothetical protein
LESEALGWDSSLVTQRLCDQEGSGLAFCIIRLEQDPVIFPEPNKMMDVEAFIIITR